jgi:hypothetical protein
MSWSETLARPLSAAFAPGVKRARATRRHNNRGKNDRKKECGAAHTQSVPRCHFTQTNRE